MADCDNQHFVPRFYFNHFTGGDRRIHLLRKSADQIIFNAPIKGQCARHKFYGPKELEAIFSQLERQHATAIRATLAADWNPAAPRVTDETFALLLHAVIFQRFRTALEVEKWNPAKEKQATAAFDRQSPGYIADCRGREYGGDSPLL